MPCLFFVYPDRHRENFLVCEPRAFGFRASIIMMSFQGGKKHYKCTTIFFHAVQRLSSNPRISVRAAPPGAAHERSPCHACPERQSPGALSKLRARRPRRPWLLAPRHRLFGLAVRRSTLWRFQHPILAPATTTRTKTKTRTTMGRAKKTPLARTMITRKLSMGRAR